KLLACRFASSLPNIRDNRRSEFWRLVRIRVWIGVCFYRDIQTKPGGVRSPLCPQCTRHSSRSIHVRKIKQGPGKANDLDRVGDRAGCRCPSSFVDRQESSDTPLRDAVVDAKYLFYWRCYAKRCPWHIGTGSGDRRSRFLSIRQPENDSRSNIQ